MKTFFGSMYEISSYMKTFFGSMYEISSCYDRGFLIDEIMLYLIMYELFHDPYAKRKEDIGIMKFEQLDYSKYSERMDGYSHDHLDAAVGEFESEKKRKTEETVWLDMLHRVS